jgi:hypothetical protein
MSHPEAIDAFDSIRSGRRLDCELLRSAPHEHSLRPSAEKVQRLGAEQSQILAAINPRLEFRSFAGVEEAIRIAVHQLLKSQVRLRRQSERCELFENLDRCLDYGGHQ